MVSFAAADGERFNGYLRGMSLFSKLLTAAAETQSTSAILRDVREAFLLEEELPVYQFAVRHIRNHGAVPSRETLTAAGFRPMEANEPASYYVDRIRQRFVYNAINGRHPAFSEAMRARNVDDAVTVLRDMLSSVGLAGARDGYSTLVAEVAGILDEYDSRHLQGGLAGITTGWPTLDEMTMGMMGGDVIVIAGRPSMGKSWMLNEVGYKAWRSGKSVVAVSMEMGRRQFARRWIGRHLGINPNFIRAGQLSHWTEVALRNYPQEVMHMSGVYISSGDMRKSVEAIEPFVAEVCPDLIMVDAAYLLTVEGRHKGGISKWERIGEVIAALKRLAISTDRPVVITVQFNRNQKSSSKKELDLGDIAGSDSIPQDASVVLGVRKGTAPFDEVRRQIVVMKNREGVVGDFETTFSFNPPAMDEVDGEQSDDAMSAWMI